MIRWALRAALWSSRFRFHSVFAFRLSAFHAHRSALKIDHIVSLGIHDAERHAAEAALGRRAPAFCIELDGARSELEASKPDKPTLVELDGCGVILLNAFRAGDFALPFLSAGDTLEVGRECLRVG